jgi:hypothetical protein
MIKIKIRSAVQNTNGKKRKEMENGADNTIYCKIALK